MKSDSNDWLTVVASFIFTNKIIPHANAQYNLIQKCWAVVEKGLTYGSQSVHVPFLEKDGYFCTDMTVPYVKNIIYETGKVSDADSNVILMEAYYQPKDIEAIIARETKLGSKAKRRGETYESGWDVAELRKIKDDTQTKEDAELTPTERKRRDSDKGGVKIVHMFQRGVGETFYSLHPKSGKIVRRKKNKDPRGEIPIVTFYAGIDGSNPRGRGFVELVCAMQNLMDSEMQMYQYMKALMTNPPVLTYGINNTAFKFIPNTVNKATIPDAYIKPIEISTMALQTHAETYGLNKSQLLNLLSSPDTSVSAEVGNPGFSKTDAGVKNREQVMSVDDNYIRKQFEAFFERWAETAINLYFAERTGVEELQLDKRTAQELRKLDGFDETLLSDDDKIRIDYDTETEKLKFEVDASTSNMKDNQQQLDVLDSLLQRYEKAPVLQEIVPKDKLIATWNSMVAASGIEDPEKLQIEETDPNDPNAQQDPNAQMQAQHGQEMQQAQQQIQELQQKLAEEQQVPYKDSPEDIKRQKEERAGYTPSASPSPDQQALNQKAADLQIKGQQASIQAIGEAHKQVDQHATMMAAPEPQQPAPIPGKDGKPVPQNPEPQQPHAPLVSPLQPKQEAPGITAEDQPVIDELTKLGLPENEIGKALAFLHHGYAPEDILNMIGVTNG